MKSFAQATRELTGMTKEEYKAAYTKFAARVRNYNRVAGTNYQAAREFYYSFRFAGIETEALKAIKETKATRAHFKDEYIPLGEKSLSETEKAAQEVLKHKWGAFIAESEKRLNEGTGTGEAYDVAQRLERGEITAYEANEMLKQLRRDQVKKPEKDPAYHY